MDKIFIHIFFLPVLMVIIIEPMVIVTVWQIFLHRKLIQDCGLWTQLRVDKGREWYLMLFIQQKLEQYRSDTVKP